MASGCGNEMPPALPGFAGMAWSTSDAIAEPVGTAWR